MKLKRYVVNFYNGDDSYLTVEAKNEEDAKAQVKKRYKLARWKINSVQLLEEMYCKKCKKGFGDLGYKYCPHCKGRLYKK